MALPAAVYLGRSEGLDERESAALRVSRDVSLDPTERLRGMFTPEEMRENFARFEHRLRDMEEAAAEAPELSIEDPEAIAERARQLGLLRELLFAPSLGTS